MKVARELLDDLATVGATIEPLGDRLILRAGRISIPASLVRRVRLAKADLLATLPSVAAVKAHKDGIKRALKGEANDPWDADDYRCFYDERAGIAEFERGLTREEANSAGFEAVVAEWLDRHPEPSPAGRCAWCRRAADARHAVVPVGVGDVHTWLHPECWPQWYEARIDRAVLELGKLGVQRPTTAPRIDGRKT